MRTRSDRFDRVVAGSHQMRSRVDVLFGGVEVDGAQDLPVSAGLYDADRTKAVMASITGLVVAAPDLAVLQPGPLTPYGYELRVRRGVVYSDGTEELLQLGIFPIQSTSIAGIDLTAGITAFDRSQLVIDARLEDDYPIAAGTNYGTAIRQLILAGVPGTVFVFPGTTFTTPDLVFPMGSDRWAVAREMAASCGWELYFDSLGQCAARVEPSVATATSVLNIDEGSTGALIDLQVGLDRAPAYNKVIASGENSSLNAVFKGSAADLDPTSPTYYLGTFGRKPTFMVSQFYTSDAQCTVAAQAKLDKVRGVARSLTLTAVPHPGLEAADGVTVRRAALAVNEVHLVDGLRMGLAAGDVMALATRTVQ